MSEVGAEARRTRYPRGSNQEELSHVQGQGWRPKVPGCDSTGAAERSHPISRARGGGREELPHTQGRSHGQEGQPHVQRVVAVLAQESLEKLFHVQGQEGWQ